MTSYAEQIQVFTLEDSLSNEIDEIISNVVGVGQSFSWLNPTAAFALAYERAEWELKNAAHRVEAEVVIALKVSTTSNMLPIPFPGFFTRQIVVLVGTAITVKK